MLRMHLFCSKHTENVDENMHEGLQKLGKNFGDHAPKCSRSIIQSKIHYIRGKSSPLCDKCYLLFVLQGH